MDFSNRPPPNLGQGITGKAGWDSNQVPLLSALGGTRVMPADQVSNAVAYATIPSLTQQISRVGRYAFSYWLVYQTSAPTEGIGVQLLYSGAFTPGAVYSIVAANDTLGGANILAIANFAAGITNVTSNFTSPSRLIIRIDGSAEFTGVGDLTLQMRAETGGANNVTIFAGSWGSLAAAA